MRPKISTRDCLRAGGKAFFQHPFSLITGWAIAAAIVVLFIFLYPNNLSLGMQLGAIACAPAILWAERVVLRSYEEAESGQARTKGSLLDWGSAFLSSAAIPAIFRTATWWIWVAVPLTGGLMYTFVALDFGDVFASGRLDLFISAILFGHAGFMISCGLFFAPLCAVVNSKGPFDAIARSWRMAGSHRLKILGMAAACFLLPVLLFLAAYFLSILRTAQAHFSGSSAVLWSISLAVTVLVSGPWFSGSLVALFIPLKEEEDAYMRRRAERKVMSNIN
jgi:hypothetical protein